MYKDCQDPEDSILIIHDGVRPLIDERLITENIEMVKKHRSSVTVSYAIETVTAVDDTGKIVRVENRDKARIAKAPQCFYVSDLMRAHHRAIGEDIDGMIDAASLMNYYGHDLHTVLGSNYNVKITTPADYYIFRALFEAEENSQIFGL